MVLNKTSQYPSDICSSHWACEILVVETTMPEKFIATSEWTCHVHQWSSNQSNNRLIYLHARSCSCWLTIHKKTKTGSSWGIPLGSHSGVQNKGELRKWSCCAQKYTGPRPPHQRAWEPASWHDLFHKFSEQHAGGYSMNSLDGKFKYIRQQEERQLQ